MRKIWSVSESYLDALWREAVYKQFGGRCALCGKDDAQAHHVVGRRRRVLRWDVQNGILLCTGCHECAHKNQPKFYRLTQKAVDYPYLEDMSLTLVDYCTKMGISKDEFRQQRKEQLKQIINSGVEQW